MTLALRSQSQGSPLLPGKHVSSSALAMGSFHTTDSLLSAQHMKLHIAELHTGAANKPSLFITGFQWPGMLLTNCKADYQHQGPENS